MHAKGLKVPEWAFKPDQWSHAFQRGLAKLNLNGLKVREVGVGTGINILILAQTQNAQWYFSDYDERCVPLAMENLACVSQDILHPLWGSWDLLTPPAGSEQVPPKVDVIFGCLPQVPSTLDLLVRDRRAHYYDQARYPEAHYNHIGLGLVETLLIRAKQVLLPQGSVVLNLGGRPGRDRLLTLFGESGYLPEIIHWETIEQHSGTSLESLAHLEGNGHGYFELFADENCEHSLNAGQAEMLRVAGEKVYHKIYVISGKLT